MIMTRKICFLALIILYSLSAVGQNNYLAGSATLSIEPGNVNFSSALAGYGVPREGRFSITWQKVDQPYKLSALAGSDDKILGVGAGKIFAGTALGNQIKWLTNSLLKSQITHLCASGRKLFALEKDGKILTGTINGKSILWKHTIQPAQSFTALTVFRGKLFAVANGNLFSAVTNTGKLQWQKAGNVGPIISLAADDRQLYGVNFHDTIWAIQPRNKYITYQEIGRNNGITSTIHIAQIAVAGKKMYALTKDGDLYVGNQNTQNNMAVNAVAIKKATKIVVIVGADVCGFNKSLTDEVKRAIYLKRKIPASAILINASHTHFVPVTQAWTTWGDFYHIPDSAYLNKVVKANMIKVIEQALDNMQPSNIYIARGQTHIGQNRRPAANPDKPYDTTLDVIKIENLHKKTTNVLFSAGCHPVFENDGAESFTINANFPAVARAIVKAKAGAAHTMFLQGCAGDINPRSLSYIETGTELANDVLKVLNGPMEKLRGEISFSLDSMHIPVSPMTLKEVRAFKDSNLTKTGDVEAEKNVRWANLMEDRYAHNTVKNYLPEYMQTLNIGQWKYVGLSREAVTQYGLAIRKLWPQQWVTVSGYCNDVPSYLPADWHITAGVYEGKDSFFWYGQPGIPHLGVLERIVSKIKANNR